MAMGFDVMAGEREGEDMARSPNTDKERWFQVLNKGFWEGANVLTRGLAFLCAVNAALLSYLVASSVSKPVIRMLVYFGLAADLVFALGSLFVLLSVLHALGNLEKLFPAKMVRRSFRATRMGLISTYLCVILGVIGVMGGFLYLPGHVPTDRPPEAQQSDATVAAQSSKPIRQKADTRGEKPSPAEARARRPAGTDRPH